MYCLILLGNCRFELVFFGKKVIFHVEFSQILESPVKLILPGGDYGGILSDSFGKLTDSLNRRCNILGKILFLLFDNELGYLKHNQADNYRNCKVGDKLRGSLFYNFAKAEIALYIGNDGRQQDCNGNTDGCNNYGK